MKKPKLPTYINGVTFLTSLLPTLCLADETAGATAEQVAAAVAPAVNPGDSAWMMISTALVLFMTPGLAFFYGGMVRTKNVVATLMQSLIALPIISLVWFAFGYSIAFSPTHGGLIGGLDWIFLKTVGGAPNADYAATIPHDLFMTFQCMFAVITPALISGAFAERMKFSAYLLFIILWSLLVYSPLAHWVWGVGGMLRSQGVLDFAGGLVVHLSAGTSAFAAALAIGPRTDFKKAPAAPASLALVVLGTGMLWFGWFGFNAGSAVGSNELASIVFTNSHFATASAATVWMILEWLHRGKPSIMGVCISMVVGLIAVTPAGGFVTISSAMLIGALAGAASYIVAVIRGNSKLDDTLDVFACHGVAGTLGVLMTGFLATKSINAAGADGSMDLFLTQLKAVGIVASFCFIMTFAILKGINLLVGLRPTPSEEAEGLDTTQHGERLSS